MLFTLKCSAFTVAFALVLSLAFVLSAMSQSRQQNFQGPGVLRNEHQTPADQSQRTPDVESFAGAVASAIIQSISTAAAVHHDRIGSTTETSTHTVLHPVASSRGPEQSTLVQQAVGLKRARYEPPSKFESVRRGGHRRVRQADPAPSPPKTTYVRDIMLMPHDYKNPNTGVVLFPRSAKRISLGGAGLVGKVEIDSSMTEIEVRREICEVFSIPMGLSPDDIKNYNLYPFTYLQRAGSGSRSLCVPSVKSTFEWNGKRVASLAKAGAYIYILADRDLPGMVSSYIANYSYTVNHTYIVY